MITTKVERKVLSYAIARLRKDALASDGVSRKLNDLDMRIYLDTWVIPLLEALQDDSHNSAAKDERFRRLVQLSREGE